MCILVYHAAVQIYILNQQTWISMVNLPQRAQFSSFNGLVEGACQKLTNLIRKGTIKESPTAPLHEMSDTPNLGKNLKVWQPPSMKGQTLGGKKKNNEQV